MKINSEQEMLECGKKLARECNLERDFAAVIEMIGDVGAGKTTLTRGLAEGLGVKEAVTSPSFTISKAYALPTGGQLVHYDFYRLGDPGLMAGDLAECISEPSNVVVVEWGESVADLLPEQRVVVKLDYNDDGSRDVKVDYCGDTVGVKMDDCGDTTDVKVSDCGGGTGAETETK